MNKFRNLLLIIILSLPALVTAATDTYPSLYQAIRANVVQLGQNLGSNTKLQASLQQALSIADQQVSQGKNSDTAYWGAAQYLYGFRDGIMDTFNSFSSSNLK